MPAPRAARAGCSRTDPPRPGPRQHVVGLGRRTRCRSRFPCWLSGVELQPLRSCRLLYLLNDTLGTRTVRVHQHRDHPSPGNQLRQQLKSLSRQPLVAELADPVRLPPGGARLATSPSTTGSPPCLKTIGMVEVVLFAASAAGGVPAMVKSTFAATRSAANAGSRS